MKYPYDKRYLWSADTTFPDTQYLEPYTGPTPRIRYVKH